MGMIVSWMLVAAAVAAFCITALSGFFLIPALAPAALWSDHSGIRPHLAQQKAGNPYHGRVLLYLGDSAVGRAGVRGPAALFARFCSPRKQTQSGLLVLFLAFGSGFIGFFG